MEKIAANVLKTSQTIARASANLKEPNTVKALQQNRMLATGLYTKANGGVN